MIAALRTPKHAITPYHSTTHPSTRISTPLESHGSPSGIAKVGNVISRVLDFDVLKKINALLDVKKDERNHQGQHRDCLEGPYKPEVNTKDTFVSMLDLHSALRTIPSDDSLYPQSPLNNSFGKAAQVLGLDLDQLHPALKKVQAMREQQDKYMECNSLASEAFQDPYGPPGAARRHFCSEPIEEDRPHAPFPATKCCWGGHLGPTYLDQYQDLSDDGSLESKTAVAVQGNKPTPIPTPPMTPPTTVQQSPPTQNPGFAYYGRTPEGWPRERPYPYLMERDVEPVYGLAGRDAIESYSRYPAMPRRQLVN
jgi:hypothetical protein